VRPPWYSAFQSAWRSGSFIAAHAIVAMLFLGVIALLQWLVLQLGDPKLFDTIPLRYIFDGMDLGILLAFLIFGTIEAVLVFKSSSCPSGDGRLVDHVRV
jgi:hypothetical protein